MGLQVELYGGSKLVPLKDLAGRVILIVPRQINLLSITVKFKCEVWSMVYPGPQNIKRILYNSHELLEVSGQVCTLGKGVYEYPFAFPVPDGYPPSFKHDDVNAVKYSFKVSVIKAGFKRNIHKKVELSYMPFAHIPREGLSSVNQEVLLAVKPDEQFVSFSEKRDDDRSIAIPKRSERQENSADLKLEQEKATCERSYSRRESSSRSETRIAQPKLSFLTRLLNIPDYRFTVELTCLQGGCSRGSALPLKLYAYLKNPMPNIYLSRIRLYLNQKVDVAPATVNTRSFDEKKLLSEKRIVYSLPAGTIVDLSQFVADISVPADTSPSFNVPNLRCSYNLCLQAVFKTSRAETQTRLTCPIKIYSDLDPEYLPAYTPAGFLQAPPSPLDAPLSAAPSTTF